MAINKVEYAGTTLIDITDSTVTPDTLAAGVIAYNNAGERIVGTMAGVPDIQTNGKWKYRLYEDSYEAWYYNTGESYDIKYASGNFYRSDPKQYTLPTALQGGTVVYFNGQIFHAQFPVMGAVSSVPDLKIQALSGANRGAVNVSVELHVVGVI